MPDVIRADALLLAWDRCAPAGGLADRTFDCATDASVFRLSAALSSDSTITGVLAAELVLDFQAESPALPDWWSVALTGCRPNTFRPAQNPAPAAPCMDPWAGKATAQLQDQLFASPRGFANQTRLLFVAAVPSQAAATLAAGSVYQLMELQLFTLGTVAGSCPGCSVPACLVLNSVRLVRLGNGEQDVAFAPPTGGNIATWQSAGAGTCQAVPIRRSTWGRIKGLYR